MLLLEELVDYCMDFPGAVQDFPFDTKTMVFKVHNKIFLAVNTEWWMDGNERINVKCEPDRAIFLRENYESIESGYHMNKKHWNTIIVSEGELSKKDILEHVDHSYNLIIKGLSKTKRALLK